jgi:phosphoribosyl 1,2-cyclic phosphodiesterase
MLVRIWGCRGSLATPGPETLRYGGNTSCVEVECDDGTRIILDAGTGIRMLGRRLAGNASGPIHLCLTHLHVDHIEGIAFFAPIFDPLNEVHVWGPPSSVRSLDERLARYLSAPLFPVEIGDLPATFVFHDVEDEPWEIGSARLDAAPISHPGATLGYRIEADGSSVAYLPDHEPAVGVPLASLSTDWLSGFDVAVGANTLLHDSQYSEEEYSNRVGWGHSSVADAVLFSRRASVEQLLLFHHDPLHDDRQLEALQARARELCSNGNPPPKLAQEGMTIELG